MQKFIAAPDVCATLLTEELVLLDLKTNHYFKLNEVGALVWSMIASAKTKSELVDRVCEQYDIVRTSCVEDVDALLKTLLSRGLVVSVPDEPL